MRAEVYINRRLAAYDDRDSFRFDVGKYINPGEKRSQSDSPTPEESRLNDLRTVIGVITAL